MTCYQCPKPALYTVTENDVPLCLDCYYKFCQINQQQLENHERLLNYFSDEADAITGIPTYGPRFSQRPKPVYFNGVEMNNITVSNSTIGTINTGSIGNIDQSITALNHLGDGDSADAIKQLTETILKSNELTKTQCNELVEILSVISKEAVTPPENREKTVGKILLEKAQEITSKASDISSICQQWWPILSALFS